MYDAPFFYLVRFWVDPKAEDRVIAWLKGGHMAEVVAIPGYLWANCIKLDEIDSLGWSGYANIYALESRAALEAYMANPIREKFARENAAFAGALRTERSWGATAIALAGASAAPQRRTPARGTPARA